MKNKILNIVIIIVLALSLLGLFIYQYYETNNLSETINQLVEENKELKSNIGTLTLSLEETTEALNTTQQELHLANEKIENQAKEIESYIQQIEDEEAKWKRRYEEYPIATEAWIAMKNQGWSDTVCAGIMGNLMAETGGTGTLHLDWDSNGGNGYGLVQWIGGRRSTIKSRYGTYPTVKEQIQFVHDELYGVNGVRKQVSDSQLNAIMNAETPEECAYAFACYYERCADFARGMRRGFARDAYEYFTS